MIRFDLTLSVLTEIRAESLALAKRRMLKAKRSWCSRELLVVSELVAVHLIGCVAAYGRRVVVMILRHRRRHRQRASRMFSQSSSSVAEPNLDPRFCQTSPLRKFFWKLCRSPNYLNKWKKTFMSNADQQDLALGIKTYLCKNKKKLKAMLAVV